MTNVELLERYGQSLVSTGQSRATKILEALILSRMRPDEIPPDPILEFPPENSGYRRGGGHLTPDMAQCNPNR